MQPETKPAPSPLKYHLQPNEPLFFLHIPKTAGMTLWHMLKHHYGRRVSWSLTRDIRNSVTSRDLENFLCFRAHMDYRYYQHYQRKPAYLTVLRHPVQHQLSRFGMKKRVGKLGLIEARDIFDYLERVPMNIQTLYLAGMKPGLSIDPDAALEVALTRLDEMAFFGVMEQFKNSLELLSYTFDWPPLQPIKPRNTAKSGDKPQLTPELEALILEKCWLDVKLYEAGLALFNERFARMKKEQLAGLP
jgi:hypothetical protein